MLAELRKERRLQKFIKAVIRTQDRDGARLFQLAYRIVLQTSPRQVEHRVRAKLSQIEAQRRRIKVLLGPLYGIEDGHRFRVEPNVQRPFANFDGERRQVAGIVAPVAHARHLLLVPLIQIKDEHKRRPGVGPSEQAQAELLVLGDGLRDRLTRDRRRVLLVRRNRQVRSTPLKRLVNILAVLMRLRVECDGVHYGVRPLLVILMEGPDVNARPWIVGRLQIGQFHQRRLLFGRTRNVQGTQIVQIVQHQQPVLQPNGDHLHLWHGQYRGNR